MLGLIAATVLLATSGGAAPETVGTCVWSRLADTERQAILTDFSKGMGQAMASLQARKAVLLDAAHDCVGRSDVPALWLEGSIASHVIQLGTAQELNNKRGIGRDLLDEVWASASTNARNCALNNAAKAFGITGPTCNSRRRVLQEFLAPLDISASANGDRQVASQTLVYMNAKAQNQIAESLIQQMKSAIPRPESQ